MEIYQQPQAQNSNKIVFTIIVLVVVGLLAVIGFKLFRPSSEPQRVQLQTEYVLEGELVTNFPVYLILDEEAKIVSSYKIDYGDNLEQFTTTFDSDKSMVSLFNQYKNYFQNTHWIISNEIVRETSRSLYALQGGAEASLVIIAQEQGSQVTISFVAK